VSVSAAVALAALLMVLVRPQDAAAHDIPNDVTVQTFLKPDGQRLNVLVRVPLAAMRDVDYPRRGARGGELLDLSRADPALRDAATLWLSDFLGVYEDDRRLPAPRVASVRASLQSDRSFASYAEALAHVTGPQLADDTQFPWNQGLLDVWFEYPIQSDRSRFAIEPKFARLGIRTVTVLRFLPADAPAGTVRAFELPGDPGLVRLDPRWHQAAFQFVKLGFEHILDGTDHLLFLFCLVIPFRKIRPLVAIITSFTVAHSITLIGSAYNLAPDALWFPPLIETLIAVSIVYMALENILAAASDGSAQRSQSRPGIRATMPAASAVTSALKRRWLIAFGFGLVHGFGFSFALRRTLQFAGSHLLTSLLSFNVGVELGQILVLLLLVPALGLLFRAAVAERPGVMVLSGLVAHTAWHWMTERWLVLRQFRFEWPAMDLVFWVAVMRWAMLAVVAAGLYWLVFGVLRQRSARPATRPAPGIDPVEGDAVHGSY
jgi:HupE/UreJ protein